MMSHLFVFVRPTPNEVFSFYILLKETAIDEKLYKWAGDNEHGLIEKLF